MSQGIRSILVTLNMVDRAIFTRVPRSERGKSVFVYNGLTKGREFVYGVQTYQRVAASLPRTEFIFSNTLNLPYDQMPNVYRKCFMALRLTAHDGNANTAQECEAMGIPIVHNQSAYGLKWKTWEDVIGHIRNHQE